ncbi:MAG: hypothetical protein NC084_09125 [Bacteroides sp.]|nr:hypothetical protein [Eubacterium sp.]MCM1419021.1 hypothetical protein [Roseburia sp.]MCM1462857.1 hypothetical protein [Bacteroides sp.]
MITILQDPSATDHIRFELKEGGAVRGHISARIADGELIVFELESEEEIFYDGLVRAVLGYAQNRFVDRARFEIDDERKKRRLRGFGFIPEDGNELESIGAFFFADHCS